MFDTANVFRESEFVFSLRPNSSVLIENSDKKAWLIIYYTYYFIQLNNYFLYVPLHPFSKLRDQGKTRADMSVLCYTVTMFKLVTTLSFAVR
jgi:hypothetical protein